MDCVDRDEDDAARGPILIVDETEANSMMTIRLLEEQGYPAVSVRNGLEATAGGHSSVGLHGLPDSENRPFKGGSSTKPGTTRKHVAW